MVGLVVVLDCLAVADLVVVVTPEPLAVGFVGGLDCSVAGGLCCSVVACLVDWSGVLVAAAASEVPVFGWVFIDFITLNRSIVNRLVTN